MMPAFILLLPLAVGGAAPHVPAWRPVPARYFADRSNPPRDLAAVRRNTEPRVSIAGRYSQAIVACGTGCTAFWIVDRRTGAVIEVPSGGETEGVYDVRGSNASATIAVVYGPADGAGSACRSQGYVLSGETLRKIGPSRPARCP